MYGGEKVKITLDQRIMFAAAFDDRISIISL